MRLAFMVPPGSGPGTRYARHLAAALQIAGHDADITPDLLPAAIPVLDGALLPCPAIPPGAVAL